MKTETKLRGQLLGKTYELEMQKFEYETKIARIKIGFGLVVYGLVCIIGILLDWGSFR